MPDRILIVEDTRARIDAFCRNNPGLTIDHTPSIEQAATLLCTNPYSLLCLDFNVGAPGSFEDTAPLASFIADPPSGVSLCSLPPILIHCRMTSSAVTLQQILLNYSSSIHRIELAWQIPNLFHILTLSESLPCRVSTTPVSPASRLSSPVSPPLSPRKMASPPLQTSLTSKPFFSSAPQSWSDSLRESAISAAPSREPRRRAYSSYSRP